MATKLYRTCAWHRDGVPLKFQGKPFRNRDCPACDEKAAKDPTLMDAPTAFELARDEKSKRLPVIMIRSNAL